MHELCSLINFKNSKMCFRSMDIFIILIIILFPGPKSVLQSQDQKVKAEFEQPLYIGLFNEKLELKASEIKLQPEYLEESTIFTLSGDDAKYFDIEVENDVIVLQKSVDFTEQIAINRTELILEINASSENFDPGIAFIVIGCPRQEKFIPSDKPIFQYESYNYFIYECTSGVVGIVNADTSNGNPVVYSFRSDDEQIKNNLQISPEDGTLELSKVLPVAVYDVDVMATNNVSGSFSNAHIYITVLNGIGCPEKNATTVTKSLDIRKLKEGERHDGIMPTIYGECQYEIESQKPGNFFGINKSTNNLYSEDFDREHAMFNDFLVPQFQIKLKLVCPNNSWMILSSHADTKVSETADDYEESDESYVLTKEISFSEKIMTINVIVVDINDNFPQFIYPEKDNMLIGYPEDNLVSRLMPRCLLEVKAIDIDEGLNAQIRFSITQNEYFRIDPESGKVTPLAKPLDNDTVLILQIFASDRNGSVNANVSHITIRIKIVKSNQLVYVTYENKDDKSIEEIFEELREQIKLDFRVLEYATVPHQSAVVRPTRFVDIETLNLSQTKFENKSTDSTFVRIVAYAFDDQEHVVPGYVIREMLLESNPTLDIELEIETPCPDNPEPQCSNLALIIVTTCLSLLLVFSILGSFAMWWFWIRPYTDLDDTDSFDEASVTQLETNFTKSLTKSTPSRETFRKATERGEADGAYVTKPKIGGFTISGAIEDDDGRFSPANSSIGSEAEIKITSRRIRTIKFNDFVESIEVPSSENDGNRRY